MTTETKSGKECHAISCKGYDKPSSYCKDCHGLGKVFAPGDALTATQRYALGQSGKEVQYLRADGTWGDCKCMPPKLDKRSVKYRLAPAPQEVGFRKIEPGTDLEAEGEKIFLHLKETLAEEPAVKVESAEEIYSMLWNKLHGELNEDHFYALIDGVISLTSAQLETLKQERSAK